jgi:hypothetical protein
MQCGGCRRAWERRMTGHPAAFMGCCCPVLSICMYVLRTEDLYFVYAAWSGLCIVPRIHAPPAVPALPASQQRLPAPACSVCVQAETYGSGNLIDIQRRPFMPCVGRSQPGTRLMRRGAWCLWANVSPPAKFRLAACTSGWLLALHDELLAGACSCRPGGWTGRPGGGFGALDSAAVETASVSPILRVFPGRHCARVYVQYMQRWCAVIVSCPAVINRSDWPPVPGLFCRLD